MTLLDSPSAPETQTPNQGPTPTDAGDDQVALFHAMSFLPADMVIDLNENRVEVERPPVRVPIDPADIADDIRSEPAVPPARVQGLRLSSVAKLASVFFTVVFAATLGATVVLWLGAANLGLIDQVEELATNALGLEQFEISGASMFGGVTVLVAAACVLGFALTLLLATVFNLAASLVGGLAIDLDRLHPSTRSDAVVV